MSFLKVVNILNPSNANASIIINTAGNVGIGSSNPAVALDVTGSTNISGNLTVLGTATLSNPSINGNMTIGGNLLVNGSNTQINSANATIQGNLNINAGNLSFAGLGQRITGDFSNATLANRVMFQTSSVNGVTAISALPNGTAAATVVNLYSSSDVANASFTQITSDQTNGIAAFNASRTGTGTYLPITFYTGGSERLRITTNGNLQIGTAIQTTNPTAVEVINNINGGGTEWVNNNSGGGNVSALSGGGLAFGTFTGAVGSESVTERMRISAAGYVGIGVTSVGAPLQVGGIAWFGSSTTGAIGILTPDPTSGANGFNIASSFATGGYGPLTFTTSATERMRITAAGYVGIGTSVTGNAQIETTNGTNAQQSVIWAKNYGGSVQNPSENADWPWPVISATAYGNYYLQTMMNFNLPGDGPYQTSDTAWSIRLNGVTASGWDNNSNTTPIVVSTQYTGLQILGPGNMRIGSANAQNVFIRTNNVDRVAVTGNGNIMVNLGTTVVPAGPSATMVVNGVGTNPGGIEYVNQNNGGGNIQALSSGGLQWGTFTGSVGSEVYSARLTLGATGILSTYYTSSTGLTTWNVAQNVIGGLHFATNTGTSTSAKAEAAITFGYANSLTNAQAGIYVTNDTSSGTWMALATTDNYSTGPQIGLSITNTGGVSVPRTWLTVPNQPAWHAYYTGTADLAITIGTTTFTYNIASVNNGANYSTSSGRFTAPVAGTYYVYAQVQYAAIVAPSFTGLYITKNGSLYVDGYTQNTGYSEPGVRATITLAAGDYLQVVANYSVSASASVIQLSAGTRNYFGGYLIG